MTILSMYSTRTQVFKEEIAEMGPTERRQVQAQFVGLFGDLQVKKLADKLKVNPRTIRRMLEEKHVPSPTLALRMKEFLDEATIYAKMTEGERAAALDQERARREKLQRKIVPEFRTDGVQKDLPPYLHTAYTRLRQGEHKTVIDMLIDRVEDKSEWDRIPEIIQPYVLETLGFAYHYTGRSTEAINTFEQALDVMSGNPKFLQMRQGCWSMIASAYLRLRQFDLGFDAVSEGIELSRGFSPLYYHALALAAGTRNPQLLAQWVGRTLEAAETSWTLDDLSKFIKRCEVTDVDFDWAKQQPAWSGLLRGLKSAVKRSHIQPPKGN